MIKHSRILEWIQTILGLSAAGIIALNLGNEWVFWAMVIFILKDLAMIAFCYAHSFNRLMISALGYMVIDITGVIRWWIF